MYKQSLSVTVKDLTAQDLWPLLQNHLLWPAWQPLIAHTTGLSPLSYGGCIDITLKKGGSLSFYVDSYQTDHVLSLRAIGSLNTRVTLKFSLDNTADGVNVTHHISIKGPLRFIYKRIWGMPITKGFKASIEALCAKARIHTIS